MDGANEFYIFHRIVFPLLRNSVVSIAIFQFLWAWDDYLWPYLMIQTGEKSMLSVALNLFNGRYSTDYAGLFAATSIAIIPVVVFYLIYQRRFIEGVTSSAIKG
jgi:multiple sugar transport system permease protein/raffinose/stachyose/melibiose transport system permease protein